MADTKEHQRDPGKLRQFIATVVVNLAALVYGTMIGWASPMTPQLQSDDPPVGTEKMTDEMVSWLTSALFLGGFIGTLCIGTILEKFGRKASGILIAIPLGLCWMLTIFATSFLHLVIGRFFAGVGGAGCVFVGPLYVSEITSDSIRGMLGSMMLFFLNFGILLSYGFGGILSFRVFAICAMVLPVCYLGAFLFLPETPIYLLKRKRYTDASKSLMWFRGGDVHVAEREMERLQLQISEDASAKSVGILSLFTDKGTVKAMVIALGLFGFQQLCGITAMISYTETIFKIAGSSMSPNTAAITIGAMQLIGSYISTSLMERSGRRMLLLISSTGMSICHLILGSFCYLQEQGSNVSSFSWLPVATLSIYMILYCLGLGPIPYVITSEVFRRDVSSMAVTLSLLFSWMMAFLMAKFFPDLVITLSMFGCFYLLSIFCALSTLFTYFLIPETKGRSLEHILNELSGVPNDLNKNDYEYVTKIPI